MRKKNTYTLQDLDATASAGRGKGVGGLGAERKSQSRSKSLPSFIGKAAVRQRLPINRQAKRPKALTGFQTADIRKCKREKERGREGGREREQAGDSAMGGARRTCPFSLARGYRHGNWKRHFGRHHNLKLKCAASGEGNRGAEERRRAAEKGKPITNQSPYRLWGPRSLPRTCHLPLATPHSNLFPENHFELDLLRASLKAALMCALKSRRSRSRSRSRTNTKTSLWSGNDDAGWQRGCKLVLPTLPSTRRRKMPKQCPKCRAICRGSVDGIRCVLCQNENNDIKNRKDS